MIFFPLFWGEWRAGIWLCLLLSFCLAVECTAYTAGWHIENCLSHQLVKVNIPWTPQYARARFTDFFLSAKGQQVIGRILPLTVHHGGFFSAIIAMCKQR